MSGWCPTLRVATLAAISALVLVAPAGADEAAFSRTEIAVGELTFSALVAGPEDGKLVLLLHGFPQTAHAFRRPLLDLARAGFRAVAPDQRGYSPGARPEPVEAYAIPNLIADVLGLADALGAERFHLVGHDWGGAVAWGVARRAPQRLLSLTVLSTPHPAAMARARREGDQGERSSYMADLAAEGAEERLLADGARGLRAILSSPAIAPAEREVYVAALGTPEALRGPLNWYRALVRGTAGGSRPRAPLSVPTLYIWGTRDPVFSPEAARDTGEHVAGPYSFHALEGVGHWILESAPDRVATLLLDHVNRFSERNAASEPRRGPRDTVRVSTLETDAELPSRGRLGGVSIDARGRIYVSNFSASVWRVDPDGHVERLPLELKGSSGNAVDDEGNLFQASFLDGRIVRLAADGTSETWVEEGLDGPVGLAVAGDGTLYVCNCRGNFVARVDPDRQVERWSRSADFDCPNGIALDVDGKPVVVSFKNGHVLKLDEDGTARRLVSLPGNNAHVAVAEDALYVTQIADNRIYRIERDGQVRVIAGTGRPGLADGPGREARLARPNGIALSPDGRALVVNNLEGPWRGEEATRIVLRRIALPLPE